MAGQGFRNPHWNLVLIRPIYLLVMGLLNHQLYIDRIDAYIDPPRPVARAIITHGHADHARDGHEHVLATPDTIAIMKVRYGENCAKNFQAAEYGAPLRMGNLTITFYPAGHILGSAQVLIEGAGERIVVTGDYKRGADSTCVDFETVPCDTLVTEATFGLPLFRHPDPKEEIGKLLRSLRDYPERAHIVGAYPLGKTQRVISLLREGGYDAPLYLHGSQVKLCKLYQVRGVNLGDIRPATGPDKASLAGAVIIAPPSAVKDVWSRRFPDPVIAVASGWMTVKQRAKQSNAELPLVISDHADWRELTDTITETGAARIWVTHGREEALVHHCRKEGLEAEPLYLQGREDDEDEALSGKGEGA